MYNRDNDIAVEEPTNHTKSISDNGIGNIDLLLTFLTLPWDAPWELTIPQTSWPEKKSCAETCIWNANMDIQKQTTGCVPVTELLHKPPDRSRRREVVSG